MTLNSIAPPNPPPSLRWSAPPSSVSPVSRQVSLPVHLIPSLSVSTCCHPCTHPVFAFLFLDIFWHICFFVFVFPSFLLLPLSVMDLYACTGLIIYTEPLSLRCLRLLPKPLVLIVFLHKCYTAGLKHSWTFEW